jgi:hypothetical protein
LVLGRRNLWPGQLEVADRGCCLHVSIHVGGSTCCSDTAAGPRCCHCGDSHSIPRTCAICWNHLRQSVPRKHRYVPSLAGNHYQLKLPWILRLFSECRPLRYALKPMPRCRSGNCQCTNDRGRRHHRDRCSGDTRASEALIAVVPAPHCDIRAIHARVRLNGVVAALAVGVPCRAVDEARAVVIKLRALTGGIWSTPQL